MYYHYFGLTEAPFSIAVNPRYLFMSPRHRDALAHLLYGVGAGGGFILLTGEVGTGKTTINRCLLEQLPPDTDVAIILNPALNAMELLASVCDELGIQYDANQHTLKTLTDKLHRFLLDNHGRGRKTVLLIDEAQHLDFAVLEQIRLLTNLETNSEKLLQIILIGQPELAHILAQPELRQLNQRITARYNLDPLTLEETGAYIQHRLQVAGMSPERVLFPAAVVRGIYKATRGIPRVINVLCDRILLGAYGRKKTRADHDMLRLAVREVLGEQERDVAIWRWLAGAGAVLLLVWAGGWLLGKYAAPPPDLTSNQAVPVPAPTAHENSAVSVDDTAPVPPAVDTVTPAAVPITEELPDAAMSAATPPIGIPQTEPLPTEPPPTQTPPIETTSPEPFSITAAMRPPGDYMAALWTLNSEQPAPDLPCGQNAQGLACIEGEVWSWNDLAMFDRPMVLQTVNAERFAAEILLLGVTDTSAWILAEPGPVQVGLAELAPYWTGHYRLLWHPPTGFEQPISLGSSGAVVAEVAQLFARLDGQPEPLADRRFNRALEQRVRMFQQQHGLVDDGVVGVQTLLKLNALLGIDTSAAQSRQQLQAAAEEPTLP